MNTTYRLFLCAAAALAAAGAAGAEPTTAPVTGHVLLLANERTVEGDVERVGEQYRVRRAVGETWLPADKVLRLCTDMDDAYRFLRGRANLNDPDECLRLARWCHGHGLAAPALENVSAAVKLNPAHAEARHLLNGLQRAAATPAGPVARAGEAVGPGDVPELNTESRAAFATKVEPILMNACAGCHTNDRGGAFKLARSLDTTSVNRVSMRQNLTAVLAQVNLNQPQDSKLLVKAVTAHDPQSRLAPLNGKQMAAYHTLEDWVQTTVAGNPHLRERAPQPAAESKTTAPTPPTVEPRSPQPLAAAKTAPPTPGGFAASRPTPAQTAPVDEFDPLPFNRQGQPENTKDDK